MSGRPREYASAAEKQKAYRDRKRNEGTVTKSCPYCHSDAFFDVTGKVRYFNAIGSTNRVSFCAGCSAYVTFDDLNRTVMYNLVIRPNLVSIG